MGVLMFLGGPGETLPHLLKGERGGVSKRECEILSDAMCVPPSVCLSDMMFVPPSADDDLEELVVLLATLLFPGTVPLPGLPSRSSRLESENMSSSFRVRVAMGRRAGD